MPRNAVPRPPNSAGPRSLMFGYGLDFEHPLWLLLLAGLPVLAWYSRRALAALGPVQRVAAMVLRCAVLGLLVLALAELQWVRTTDRMSVLYVLDQSLSVPPEHRRAMVEWVNRSIRRHRHDDDRAGVIVFGRRALVEIPPFDDAVQLNDRLEAAADPQFDPRQTNLADALRLAQATFPEGTARRVVVVSDGNQTQGDAVEQARLAVEAGIGIDAVPVTYSWRGEVLVESVSLPGDVPKGQPVDVRVVLTNTRSPQAPDAGRVRGTLRISEVSAGTPRVLAEQVVTLEPGTQAFSIRQTIDEPNFYQYEARFIPENPADDTLQENNRGTAFLHVRGSGQVLLVVDHLSEIPEEHRLLVERLRQQNLEVHLQPTNSLFGDLADLQRFDTVVLANVPRERFSDRQVQMLVRNTQQLGAGLVMLGGANSFGAGGWANTELEAAMPVDFQIKNVKVVPKGALALILHASEMARGNYWQKVIAAEAIKALGPEDYAGLLNWDGRVQWLWDGLEPVGENRDRMLARLDRMTPGDMPEFEPAMVEALRQFNALPEQTVRHMVIISDGDPVPPGDDVLKALRDARVTVTTVAVATHDGISLQTMQRIASATGGQFYNVLQPTALPRIIQREARRVARPLIYENEQGFTPRVSMQHEMLSGIEGELPPLFGFIMTTPKDSPLRDISIYSPRPAGVNENAVLASWVFGLGKSVAFTSDTGSRWARRWAEWPGYDQFFSQMIRWSMRPTGDPANLSVATDVRDGRVHVILTALDQNDEFLNFLDVEGAIVGPNMQAQGIKLEQVGPGRYVTSFEAPESGSYLLTLLPGQGLPPVRTGVNVPYSDEFRQQTANPSLLEALARLSPAPGVAGQIVGPLEGRLPEQDAAALDQYNPFRRDLPPATSRQDVWHLLLLAAACLLFADVFVRRVSVPVDWIPRAMAALRDRLRRRETAPAPVHLDRLRQRKAEVSQAIQQRRAAFEETAPGRLPEPLLPDGPTRRETPQPVAENQPAESEETYTQRLLRAKKQARRSDEPEK